MDEAANQLVMQTVFMNGLHMDTRRFVEQMRIAGMGERVQRAQGFHTANNKGANTLYDEVPAGVKGRFKREEDPVEPRILQYPKQKEEIIEPKAATPQGIATDSQIEALTKQMSDLKIYISNNLGQRRNIPVQRFGRERDLRHA